MTLQKAAATRQAEVDQLQQFTTRLAGEAFRWLKASFEAARLEAQSMALREIGKQIRRHQKK